MTPLSSSTPSAGAEDAVNVPKSFSRIVPLVVACPLFLQNLDTTVMVTALPSIAHALEVRVVDLDLAITAYLLTLTTFLPISGWLAERFGPRRMFCAAIILFSLGSALCGVATSVSSLVAWRIVQGLGGAVMLPVSRLILLRAVPSSHLVVAMVWFTVPGAIGRLAGPFFGGAIVTIASWHWIFLINIPFGAAGVALALAFIDRDPASHSARRLDILGFVLLAVGLTALVGSLEALGKGQLSPMATVAGAAMGIAALLAYSVHSRRSRTPLIDLSIFSSPSYRAAVLGGMPMRIAFGASPFLLPLMLQVGFGFSPMESGLLTMATGLGSLGTRTILEKTIAMVGIRNVLVYGALLTSVFYAAYGLLSPSTPVYLICAVLLLGGLFNAMALITLNAFGFNGLPRGTMSDATTASTMVQQFSVCLGVVLGAGLLEFIGAWHGRGVAHMQAADFSPTFIAVGAVALLSAVWFVRLPTERGQEH